MRFLGVFMTFAGAGLIAAGIEEYIRKIEGEWHKKVSLKTFFFSWFCYSYLVALCIILGEYLWKGSDWLYADVTSQTNTVLHHGLASVSLAVGIVLIRNKSFIVKRKNVPDVLSDKPNDVVKKLSYFEKSQFIIASLSFAIILLATKGSFEIDDFRMGTTALFSYKYGFVCRSLIGTCLGALSKMLDLPLSVRFITQYSIIITALMAIIIIAFCYYAGICADTYFGVDIAKTVLLLGFIFISGVGLSTFYIDIGRSDILMLIFSLIGCWLTINQKGMFMIFPLTVICSLIHEGYIFMYANTLFAALLYRILSCIERKEKKKALYCISVLVLSLLSSCGLFLFFYFWAKPSNGLLYISVLREATDLIKNPGEVFPDLIYAIQGQLFGDRWSYSKTDILYDRIEYIIPILVAFSPFIILFFIFWKNVWHEVKKYHGLMFKKILYYLLPFGSLVTLPLFAMHMDYWRWYYQICFYELFIVLVLIACGDRILACSLQKTSHFCGKIPHCSVLLVLYAVALGPFHNDGFEIVIRFINGLKTIANFF